MIVRILAVTGATLVALIAGLIGLIVAAVAVVALFFDANDVKDLAADAASGVLGREVEFRGDAALDLGWTTRIRLEDVRVANAEWSEVPDMATVGSLDVALDVRRLLRGDIVLPRIEVVEPRLRLEKNAEGVANWQFGGGREEVAQSAAPDERRELPVVRRLEVRDAHLTYDDATTDRSVEAAVDRAVVTEDAEDRRVRAEADGRFQGRPLRLRFAGGSWDDLLAATEPYPVDVDLTLGDLRAKAEGSIDDPAQLRGMNLTVDVSGDDTARLFDISGIALPPSPPYRFTGRVDRRGDTWSFTDATGRLGDSDVRGSMAVTLGERLRLTADLVSDKLVLDDLLPFVGATPGGAEGQSEAARQAEIAARGGRVLPDKEIDTSRLQAMDAEVSFAARDIVATSLPIDRLTAKISLEDGVLRMQPAEVGIGRGVIRSYMSLYGKQQPVQVDIESHIQSLSLKELLRGTPIVEQTAGTLNGQVKLSSTGASVADILGTADGEVFTVMSGGRISHLIVEAAGLDIAEAIGVAISGDEPIPVRCIVTHFRAQDGVFRTQTMVVDTEDTVIVGQGSIDMGSERIDLTVEPKPKDFSPLTVRSPISIQGTLGEPSAFPDPAGIGVDTTVKKAINAVLTPILGLLPPIDTGGGNDRDCGALIRQAQSTTQ